jgi:ABC-type antimicrobial peptide transport system permease subunit
MLQLIWFRPRPLIQALFVWGISALLPVFLGPWWLIGTAAMTLLFLLIRPRRHRTWVNDLLDGAHPVLRTPLFVLGLVGCTLLAIETVRQTTVPTWQAGFRWVFGALALLYAFGVLLFAWRWTVDRKFPTDWFRALAFPATIAFGVLTFAGVIVFSMFGALILFPPPKNWQGITLFPKDLYYLERIPSEVNFTAITFTMVITVVVSLISSIYPALQASLQDPVESIRNE